MAHCHILEHEDSGMMTEISVGAVTAAIWANEPLGARELTGVALITLAGLCEFLYAPIRKALMRDG